MPSTFSDDSAVRLADTVQPAVWMISRWHAGCWNGKQLPRQCPQLLKLRLFLPPGRYILIRKHLTLQVAGDFIRVAWSPSNCPFEKKQTWETEKYKWLTLKKYVCGKLARPVFYTKCKVRAGPCRPLRPTYVFRIRRHGHTNANIVLVCEKSKDGGQ